MYTYKHTRNLPWYVRETLWLFKRFKSLYTKYMGASQCLYIHTRAHTLNAYLYIHARTHAHVGMRRTRDNLLLVHGRTHVHTYIHKYTCGLAHARRCCPPSVCLSLSRLHGQPSPGANISVSNVQVCICLCIWHAYTSHVEHWW
jgi:hypothetical protein